MTIAEKLKSIKESKDAIKQAIEDKGVACGDVLSEYAEKIADIPTGGIDMSIGIKFANSTFTTEQFEALNTYNWDKISDVNRAFANCSQITAISSIDISRVRNVQYLFIGCPRLDSVSMLNCSNVVYTDGMFSGCTKLRNLGGFLNLSVNLNLSDSPLLTVESLMNVINNLKDLTGSTAHTLTLGATNLAKLTDEQKAVATNKNWVLA